MQARAGQQASRSSALPKRKSIGSESTGPGFRRFPKWNRAGMVPA